MKDKLLEITKKTNPKGISKRIKSDKDLYNNLIQFCTTHNISNINEAIYWIFNSVTEKPKCRHLSDNCISNVEFISLEKGYRKYCKKCVCKSDEWKESMRQSMMTKYGVANAQHIPGIKEKRIATSLEKYGTESPNQNPEVKEKKQKTLELHYGSVGLAHPDIKKRRDEKSIELIGVSHHTKLQETQDKKRRTNEEKYGVDQWMKLDSSKLLLKNKWENEKKEEFTKYVKQLIQSRNFELISEYTTSHENITIKCNVCHNQIDIVWNTFQQSHGLCPTCTPRCRSYAEDELCNYITELGITNIIKNTKQIIGPFELDIYLPDYNLAIEYCGLWFHSSGGDDVRESKPDTYHLHKLEECNKKGIRLITIFEDEWVLKKDIVKSKISYILKKNNSDNRIHGRKCIIKEIDHQLKKQFLDANHLQGDSISNINLGAYYNNELISVMSFAPLSISKGSKSDSQTIELARFCNKLNFTIPGIASRLLKYFRIHYHYQNILSYADRRWSEGKVYQQLGFQLKGMTFPSYWYWGKKITGRKHRFNYRKSQLQTLPSYSKDLTEKQIMALEGYSWIYDCGHMKFLLHTDSTN